MIALEWRQYFTRRVQRSSGGAAVAGDGTMNRCPKMGTATYNCVRGKLTTLHKPMGRTDGVPRFITGACATERDVDYGWVCSFTGRLTPVSHSKQFTVIKPVNIIPRESQWICWRCVYLPLGTWGRLSRGSGPKSGSERPLGKHFKLDND